MLGVASNRSPFVSETSLSNNGRPSISVSDLIRLKIIVREEWEELPKSMKNELSAITDPVQLLNAFLKRFLLTPYQVEMIRQGKGSELILGQYRILEPLGRGGMGVVFRGEHTYLKRPVAIKVVAEQVQSNQSVRERFNLEARAASRLRHPNIVTCLDAGREDPPGGVGVARDYYVMDLIPGADLAATVATNGPLAIHRAASIFHQVAEGLSEAHRLGLVHRDIKPSNIIVTPDWKAKILDFGLARYVSRDQTEAGLILGSVGYMAPEQARDPRKVDQRADLFSLGACLFFALTGVEPFPSSGAFLSDLSRRLTERAPRISSIRSRVPTELVNLIDRLLDPEPSARFPSAMALASALTPFRRWRDAVSSPGFDAPVSRVLIVDDDASVRSTIRSLLEPEFECHEASNGADGLSSLESKRFDLVVLDHEMPRVDGSMFLARLDMVGSGMRPMILYMSDRVPADLLGGVLLNGADDLIHKPITPSELISRVRGLIKRRSVEITPQAISIGSPTHTISKSALAGIRFGQSGPLKMLATAVAGLLEENGIVGRKYHARLPQYISLLASRLSAKSGYEELADPVLVDLIGTAAQLHDIGMLAIPLTILQKPGSLDENERLAVQSHVSTGSDLLTKLESEHGDAVGIRLAIEIARSHHERWDGAGYPDGLMGAKVPLGARLVGLVAAYDSLRSRRPFRPGLSHARAIRVIVAESIGNYDPTLISAFSSVSAEFDRVFQGTAD